MNKVIIINMMVIAMLGMWKYTQAGDYVNSLKIRSAAFIPQSKLFREIYGTVGPCLELEYVRKCSKHVEAWGNFDWFWQHGTSVGLCSPTRLHVANFSFGLNFPFLCRNNFEAYCGVGPTFAAVLLTNSLICGFEKISKPAVGLMVKSGLNYTVSNRALFNVFADYLYQPVHFPNKRNIGGIRIGAGLGISF